jgi:5-methyltetrahydrofolate--homocysteine methyltransferase
MVYREGLEEGIMDGDVAATVKIVQEALEGGASAKEILEEGLIGVMKIVGVLFRDGEIFVPEVLMAAKAMKAGMELLKPLLAKSGVPVIGTVIFGTVLGDIHDIGKRVVSMMLEGSGFVVIDIGVNTPPQKFVDAVKENNADFCMMSALLTTTMPNMKVTIDALKAAGLGEKIKTMVGGASLNQSFADRYGADGYGVNATVATEVAKALIGKPS